MKYLLILVTLLFTSCVFYEDVECNYDSDCYLEEVCHRNQCIWVGAPAGTVVSECELPIFNYSPGDVFENDYCASGLEIVQDWTDLCCDRYGCYTSWVAVCL